jgi:hypothetical protein
MLYHEDGTTVIVFLLLLALLSPTANLGVEAIPHTGLWRGGDRGDNFMGSGALAGSRRAREDQIKRMKWGPWRPNHALQKGPKGTQERNLESVIKPNWWLVDNNI